MDYLEYFNLYAEPFAHAPSSRFYYDSHQHREALDRLTHIAKTMKGLALLVGDIGHGKTTLARRMLDSLPDDEFEAALLVIVHGGVTANWLLKRIAKQLGVEQPGTDKLEILSQLYERLLVIHKGGKRAVVLIDEAQMLATRELMEEFRGLLNLELPGHKLISFLFFGLPEMEVNLRLDPPLAQRVALRYHLRPLTEQETLSYVHHRLQLAGGSAEIMPSEAVKQVHDFSRGVPRVINTLCDNVLLEMFFCRQEVASARLVEAVADNLGLGLDVFPPQDVPPPVKVVDAPRPDPARDEGSDAIVSIDRSPVPKVAESVGLAPADIAARVASEAIWEERAPSASDEAAAGNDFPQADEPPGAPVDIADPLAFLRNQELAPTEVGDSDLADSDTYLEHDPEQLVALPGTDSLAARQALARSPGLAAPMASYDAAVLDVAAATEVTDADLVNGADNGAAYDAPSSASGSTEDELPSWAGAWEEESGPPDGLAALSSLADMTERQPSGRVQDDLTTPPAASPPRSRRQSGEGSEQQVKTSKGKTIDLGEIDDLLADLKSRKK